MRLHPRLAVLAAAAAAIVAAGPAAAVAPSGTPGAAPAIAVPAAQAATETPRAIVESFQETLLQAMKTNGFQQRVDLLRQPIRDSFHLEVMIRTIAGRYWRDAAPQAQQDLLDAFATMTTANYAARFNSFNGQEFSVLDTVEGPRGTQIVRTQIKPQNKDAVAISYVLGQQGGTWGIVDVVVGGGVSELATKRSEYADILKRQGVAGLAETLRIKGQELTGS